MIPRLVPELGPEELAADARLMGNGFRRVMLDTTTRWQADLGALHVRLTRSELGYTTLELGITDPDGVMWRPWSIDIPPDLVALSHEAVEFTRLIST